MKESVKKIMKGINIFLIILVVYFSKDIFSNYFFNQNMVIVPNVTKLKKEEAIEILEKSNLSYNIINSRSNEVPTNVVYSQAPLANEKVKINRAIKLYVNSEEGDKIPKIKNLVVEDAIKLLKEKNIEIFRVDYVQTNSDEDIVISSFPKEGSLIKYGEKISLLVGTRKLSINNRVPNIIGLDISEGKNILEKLEYNNISIIGVNDLSFPLNIIVKTDPTPNTELSKNELIKIYVSIAEENKEEEKRAAEEDDDVEKSIEEILRKTIKNNENKD